VQRVLTAIFKKVPEGYIGFVEEFRGANTQGATLDEARMNLREAAQLVLDTRREQVDEGFIREPLILPAT
jgi:predicted RNase H-like HicB family nuclease